jgi:hypothetical protein
LNERLDDPIKQLVLKYFSASEANKRHLPNADSVVPDANGLQILIKCGCLRSVVNLTHKILQTTTSTKSPLYTSYAMQIWFVRIACLMKLKLFKEADEELKQFGDFDQAHFYFEFEQTGQQSRKGNVCN